MKTLLRTIRSYGAGLVLAALLLGTMLFGTAANAKAAPTSPQTVAMAKRGAKPGTPPTPATKRSKAAPKKAAPPRPANGAVDWVPAETVDEYFRE